MNHFTSLVDRLTLEDIEILNSLTSKEATNRFSAKTKDDLINETQLNETRFRKCLIRLEAMNFVEIVTGNRKHLMYVTEYGQQAIQNIYERSNTNVY